MTSGYSVTLQGYCPFIVTVLSAKDAVAYGEHFDQTLDAYSDIRFQDEDDFYDLYPGNISDMSDALHKGWVEAMQRFVEKEFEVSEIPTEILDNNYYYCQVHWERSIHKASMMKMKDFVSRGPDLNYDICRYDTYLNAFCSNK